MYFVARFCTRSRWMMSFIRCGCQSCEQKSAWISPVPGGSSLGQHWMMPLAHSYRLNSGSGKEAFAENDLTMIDQTMSQHPSLSVRRQIQ